MDDEYIIKPILEKHGIDNDELLKDLSSHFDRFCHEYMDSHDGIRNAAFTEVLCFLMVALREHQTGKVPLQEGIQKLIGSLRDGE